MEFKEIMKKYFTPLGFKKFQDEWEWLVKQERPAVTKVVSWAASLGDRSENADYLYGKKRLREIDRRINFLSSRMDRAEVIDPEKVLAEKVLFGATVTLQDEDESIKRISIVGIDEVDTKKNYLSWKSPIGSSLLGKELNDQVIIKTPNGTREFEIIKIEYVKIMIEEFVGESSVSGFTR